MQEHSSAEHPRRRPPWRGVALVLIGLVVGAMFVGSAGAHIGTPAHLWKQHIKPKANQRYAWQVKYIRSSQVLVNSGNVGQAEATCPAGWVAIGGGGASTVIDDTASLIWSFPSDGTGNGKAGRTAWWYAMENQFVGPAWIRAYVICTDVAKVSGNYAPGANQA